MSQVENNVCFFINGSELKSQDVRRMMNLIYLENDIKLNSIQVIHFTKENELRTDWILKKKKVEYKPSKVDCDFNICQSIASIYSYVRTTNNTFYNCQSKKICDLNDNDLIVQNLNSKSESIIIETLRNEINKNKIKKVKQTIFFYIEESGDKADLDIVFNSSVFNFKEGESNQISLSIIGSPTSITWEPKEGLSCYDCAQPSFVGNSNMNYRLLLEDSLNCIKTSKSITINYTKSCLCDSEIKMTSILFEKADSKYYNPSADPDSDWEWQIISNQSGGHMFDLFCSLNCTKKFKVIIRDPKGKQLKVQNIDLYDENDLEDRNFEIIRLDLGSIARFFEDPRFYSIVEIIPIDGNNLECTSKSYVSPKIRFTKCTD